jgi:hypothetical protein
MLCSQENDGVLYGNHITLRRNQKNRLRSLVAQNLRTNARQRLRPLASSLKELCRNHIIKS